MWFYIICLLMKVIINLKSGHKDFFCSLYCHNGVIKHFIEILYVLMKHYMFFVFFARRVRRLLFLVYHVAFSLFYQGKYFFQWSQILDIHLVKVFFFLGDNTFHRGKLLTNNVIKVNFSSTKQFSSTIFDVPLPLKNYYTFSDYFHLGIVNFEGSFEGFFTCY